MNILITHGWSEQNIGDYAIEKAIKKVCEDITQLNNNYIYWSNFDKYDDRILQHNEFKLRDENVSVLPSLFGTPPFKYSKYKKLLYVIIRFIASCILLFTLFIQRLFFKKIIYLPSSLHFLKEIDFAVVKGGTFLYSPQGIRGVIFTFRIALPIIVLNLLKIKFIVAPHSLGPFDNVVGNKILKIALKKADVILCRENVSIKDLKDIGLNNTEFCPDMAFYLGKNLLIKNKVLNNNLLIGITVRPWKFLGLKKSDEIYINYINELSSALIQLSMDYQNKIEFSFIPQVIGPDERENDNIAIQDIISRIKNYNINFNIIDIKNREPENLIEIYSKFDILIGTRMHSIILGFLTARPAIAISYLGPKHVGIMNEYNLGKFVVSMENIKADFIVEKVKVLYADLESYQNNIKKITAENISKINIAFRKRLLSEND